jgi:hypothetical protein
MAAATLMAPHRGSKSIPTQQFQIQCETQDPFDSISASSDNKPVTSLDKVDRRFMRRAALDER